MNLAKFNEDSLPIPVTDLSCLYSCSHRLLGNLILVFSLTVYQHFSVFMNIFMVGCGNYFDKRTLFIIKENVFCEVLISGKQSC